MPTVDEPNVKWTSAIPASNSKFVLNADTPVVGQVVEYTEGSDFSPYFIPSSLCEDSANLQR